MRIDPGMDVALNALITMGERQLARARQAVVHAARGPRLDRHLELVAVQGELEKLLEDIGRWAPPVQVALGPLAALLTDQRDLARDCAAAMGDARAYGLANKVWLAVDTDGNLLAWASEPDGPADAREAAAQVLRDLRDDDDEGAPTVEAVMRQLSIVEVEVRAGGLEELARGVVALLWAPSRDQVRQVELDLVDAGLMQADEDCPHCRGSGLEALGGTDYPCRYCLEPRVEVDHKTDAGRLLDGRTWDEVPDGR